ncbi:MAG: serine--tRNA ligase [Defluviitaleaceae bacterium]|nr:serine--tRNA ligase [Defluviitaleaceae bacterium]
MQDIRNLRENFEATKAALAKRGGEYNLEQFAEIDKRRKELLQKSEEMKARQNAASKQIPLLKKEGKSTDALMAEMKELSEAVKALEPDVRAIDEELESFLMGLPNTPHPSTPEGQTDADNLEIRKWGEPTAFGFEPQPHWDLGEALGMLDPAAAAKIAGARFMLFRGLGARLERAIASFMLDTHSSRGYTEVAPPFLAHRRSMTGTGQLPKFEEDMFHISDTDFFLIPTAEVPVTNIHREEILDAAQLPIKYCAYSPSFRKEGGSAGRDTRGLIRLHQFDKVEIVKFVHPDNSYAELESLTADAEHILQLLKLPYRCVQLCAGDLGVAGAKTYDLEVWMPSYNRYVEISSCTNFEAYQARRANIRFKEKDGKPAFAHTLNGSGLAVGRTAAAIIENYQQADGSIKVPDVLVPYMGVEFIR